MIKEFTKSDLKNRMIVELRNGDKYLVVDNRLLGESGYLFLTDTQNVSSGEYNENLIFVGTKYYPDYPTDYSHFDIMKVYREVNKRYFEDDPDCLFLLWERKPIKEVTMAEVEAKFGCRVKIIND